MENGGLQLSLAEIVATLGGVLDGVVTPENKLVQRIAPLETADQHSISFCSDTRYQAQLAKTKAACVVLAPSLQAAALEAGLTCIVTDNPYAYFARLTQWWQQSQRDKNPLWGAKHIHPSAVVDERADIHPSAHIGPLCVIERGASIGADTVLTARVHIGQGCSIGQRCILHPGVVIGADGFGFAPENGRWLKIAQLGAVRIGDDVEIGANTCIDRGALDDTVIGEGVKIDNLVQIAHNVQIGAHTVIAGNTGIAGSAKIGEHCAIGGAANILGHLSIASGTQISPTSMVTRSIHRPGLYTGIYPIQTNAEWERTAASIKQVDKMRQRMKKLEQTISAFIESQQQA
ncbi:MAG: UDP-3-O-(3-hydroxymyristoyl)glucosamine N-acyltransferase [Comamonas sp.]|nr:UDP-3-O-(3-hydroxymyristoyl)glucosamine N-acyltransferase [Comamonas sp.]